MSDPSVLIVVPTYDRVKYLPRLLSCFISQDYRNVEMVIVNDQEMLSLEMSVFKTSVINVSRKMTLAAKLNIGSLFNNSDYIMYWSDDDMYLEEQVSHFVRALKENPDKNVISDNKTYTHYNGQLDETEMNSKNFIVRRSTYENCGGFKSPLNNKVFDEFLMSIPNEEKLLIDNDDPYFVYSWTGVNYHTSVREDYDQFIPEGSTTYQMLTYLWIEPKFDSWNAIRDVIQSIKNNTQYNLRDKNGVYVAEVV